MKNAIASLVAFTAPLVTMGVFCVPLLHCGSGGEGPGAPSNDAGIDATNDGGPTATHVGDAGGTDATSDGDPNATQTGDAGGTDGTSAGDAGSTGATALNINGTLNDEDNGSPLALTTVVIIDAHGTVTTTNSDASGHFHATGVVAPYDIGVPSNLTARYFSGISRPDPVVFGLGQSTIESTTVKWSATVCSGCTLWFSGPDLNGVQTPSFHHGDPFSYVYPWPGAAPHSVAFHFLLQDATGAFTQYLDIPSQPLTPGAVIDLVNLALLPTTNGTLSVTVAVPSSYHLEGSVMTTILGADQSRLATSLGPSGLTNFPKLAGTSVGFDAFAGGPGGAESYGSVAFPEAAVPPSVTLKLPATPPLLAPTPDAGVTASQNLAWSAYATPTVYRIVIDPTAPGGRTYVIDTSTPSFGLSRLATAGIALQSATNYTWLVQAGGLVTNMNDYVRTQPAVYGQLSTLSESASESFTTQ
jgi:hypothetical protein